MNQPRIICDNSVWYRIGDGRIDKSSISGLQLIATFVNGHELTSSPNLFVDYQLVRDAVVAMLDFKHDFIMYQPIEFMKHTSNNKADLLNWHILDQAMDKIYFTLRLRDETRDKAQKDIEAYSRHLTVSNQPFIKLVEEYRQRITHRGQLKRALQSQDSIATSLTITKQLIEGLANGTSIQWDSFELFILTFDRWLYELSIQDSLMMNNNDWNDLLNLVYVPPGCLYWTEDNKKTKEFIRNAGCAHYLYKHNAPVN